jgi:hypothetical protein
MLSKLSKLSKLDPIMVAIAYILVILLPLLGNCVVGAVIGFFIVTGLVLWAANRR